MDGFEVLDPVRSEDFGKCDLPPPTAFLDIAAAKVHAAKARGHLPRIEFAEGCAQPAEPIPSLLSARSRAWVHK
jgi:hypothetical protein